MAIPPSSAGRWPHVDAMRRLYGHTLGLLERGGTPAELLAAQADALHAAHAAGDPGAVIQIANWHPERVGSASSAAHVAHVLGQPFGPEDARLTLAREHGFDHWDAVQRDGQRPFDAAFERGADAVVEGDLERLGAELSARPELVSQRSPFGHGATLLHYAGSNAVETWRQRAPANLVQVVQLLVRAGASRRACMRAYGGEHTAHAMAASSAHPRTAGIRDALLNALAVPEPDQDPN